MRSQNLPSTRGSMIYHRRRLALWLFFSLAGLIAARPPQQSPQPSQAQTKPPVLVELFTSEGCSDCPPADNILNAMARQPPADLNIIPLAFHVTYWNHLGWQDRFSAERYTERQQQYRDLLHFDNIYTPQTVIDGRYEIVGNNDHRRDHNRGAVTVEFISDRTRR